MVKKWEESFYPSFNQGYVDLSAIIKSHDIEIKTIDLYEINGAYISYNNEEIFVINENLDWKEQRFAIAHELCHYMLWEKNHPSKMEIKKNSREMRADKFAMNFLLPTQPLINVYKEEKDTLEISNIFWAPEFQVKKKLTSLINKLLLNG